MTLSTFLNIFSNFHIEWSLFFGFIFASLFGFVIAKIYDWLHRGPLVSTSFKVSLMVLPLVVSVIIRIVATSVALSLGALGSLSVIRFRTPIKDPIDLVYIFWAIAMGLCAGAGYVWYGLSASLVLIMILVVSSWKGLYGRGEELTFMVRLKADHTLYEPLRSFVRSQMETLASKGIAPAGSGSGSGADSKGKTRLRWDTVHEYCIPDYIELCYKLKAREGLKNLHGTLATSVYKWGVVIVKETESVKPKSTREIGSAIFKAPRWIPETGITYGVFRDDIIEGSRCHDGDFQTRMLQAIKGKKLNADVQLIMPEVVILNKPPASPLSF